MAYRDELESRRAHVARLEAQLRELEEDERHLVSVLRGPRTWRDRLAGGPRVLERVLRVPAELSDDALVSLLETRYEVDGRVSHESGELIWKGDPEPRPRSVEVRVVRRTDAAELHITDTGSYRPFAALAALGGIVPQVFTGHETDLRLFMLGVVTVMAGFIVAMARTNIRKRARRAAMQIRALARDAEAGTHAPRVRVAVSNESDADGVSDALTPDLVADARAGRQESS